MFYLESKNENSIFGEIARGEWLQKKSKFLSFVFVTKTEEEALNAIQKVKKKYADARHVVYIYSILEQSKIIRFSEDGEPQGTGTKAIYELLEKETITNVCIVTVRYFGGILLGAGPLTRAYLNVAKDALSKCDTHILYRYESTALTISYPQYERLLKELQWFIQHQIVILQDVNFHDSITIQMKLAIEKKQEIESILNAYEIEG